MCLREIDRLSTQTESRLQQSLDNEGLLRLLALEKSLVYFSTSLKSDETTLQKIHRGKQIKLYEEDEDLWEDVVIEMNQATEMCNIYSNILSQMRETYNSVISNNMNNVMKMLAIVTVVLSIPNIIYACLLTVVGCVAAFVWLIKSNKFK